MVDLNTNVDTAGVAPEEVKKRRAKYKKRMKSGMKN